MRIQWICVALVNVLLFSSAFAQWVQTNGPEGGGISVLATSPDGANVYASQGVDIFRSTDNGLSWTSSEFSDVNNVRVNCLIVSGGKLFVGSPFGIICSTDEGQTWSTLNAGWPTRNVNSFAVSGTNLFASSEYYGIYLSTDNGTSWGPVNSSLPNLRIQGLAAVGTNIFASIDLGVYRSTNNGASWVPTGLTQGGRRFAVMGTTLFATTSLDGIAFTTDMGTTWTATSRVPTSTIISTLAVSGMTLFAGTEEDGVFRTTDNGVTWTEINFGLANKGVYCLSVSGSNLFAGTDGSGILRSTDAGTNWVQANSGLIASSANSLAFTGNTVFAGSGNGGAYISTDNGTSWSQSGLLGKRISQFAVSGNSIFAGTAESGVYRTTDDGITWIQANSGLTNPRVTSLVASGADLYVGNGSGSGSCVFRSSDNGASWTQVGPSDVHVSALAVSGTDLFAGTWTGGILRSSDHGTSWMSVFVGEYNTFITSFVVCGTTLFAGRYNGGVIRSTDGGVHWTQAGIGSPRSVYSFAASDTYVFAGGGGVFFSADNGVNWTAVNTGLGVQFVPSLAIAGSDLLAGTEGEGVWRRPLSEIITTPTSGSLTVNVKNRSDSWPVGWSGRVCLYDNAGVQAGSSSLDPATGSATIDNIPLGSGHFLRAWLTPSPQTVFGEEFWGRQDGITLQGGAQTVTFTCNTPEVTDVRAYNAATGKDVTGGTITLGTTLRLAVTIKNPMQQGAAQTLYSRLILDGDKLPGYAFDSGVSAGVLLPAGSSQTMEFQYTPELKQPYYAVAAALIKFFEQPTVTDGQAWTNTPLVTVVAPEENPIPVLSEISPAEKTAGEDAFTLVAKGEKFISSSIVRFNGQNRPTTYLSATEIQAAVPASDIDTAGSYAVTVYTPAPGGGTSAQKTLSVLPVHTLTFASGPSGNPNPAPSGSEVTCTVACTDSRGHTLNYAWSAEAGSFTRPTDSLSIWRAPVNTSGSDLTYTITVTVGCTGLSETKSYQQVVKTIAVGVVERLSDAGVPKEAVLSQNYPNPFNPQTTIRFGLPHESNVTLSIYSILGQELMQLVKSELEPGYYEVQFDGSHLASGIYIYQMKAGEFVRTQKMMVVK